MITRAFSALRRLRLWARSLVLRGYLQAGYKGISCDPSVRFGRGVTVQAFDGGTIRLGPRVFVHDHAVLIAERGRIELGEGVLVGRGSVVVSTSGISIGKGTLIAEHVTIRDQDHDPYGPAELDQRSLPNAPIAIGENVWLAAKVTVTKGVEIAAHAVVGANSVVTRSLLQRGVYAGAPARLLRAIGSDDRPC